MAYKDSVQRVDWEASLSSTIRQVDLTQRNNWVHFRKLCGHTQTSKDYNPPELRRKRDSETQEGSSETHAVPRSRWRQRVFFRQGHSSQAVNLDRGSACVSVRALGCPEREHDLGEELGRALE